MRWSIVGIAMILSPGAGASGSEDVDLTGAKSMTADGELNALDAEDRDIARQAAEVLAEELGVPISEIQVDTVRAVDWPDSSIGCPQPGQAYLQVITPGHKITLRHDGRIHTVHEAGGRAFVCRQRKDPTRPTGQIDLVWGPQALVARSDLAERLGVAPESIIIAGATRTRFPDAGLDCPEPGVEYAPDERDGFVLRLRHGGRDFTYHTDLERTVICPGISTD